MILEITHPVDAITEGVFLHAYNPRGYHSAATEVESYTVEDRVLHILHTTGKRSFVVLGKGYTVTER